MHSVRHEIHGTERQGGRASSPIYGITIQAGYRDWRLIAVGHLAGGNLRELRAQLGNDIAIKAFREGKLPFPDGTIIAALLSVVRDFGTGGGLI